MRYYSRSFSRSFAPRQQQATITLERDGSLRFESPYDAGLVAALKSRIPYADRKWDNGDKVWLVAAQHANLLADIAEQHLGSRPGIPAIQVQAQTTTRLLDVRYLGAAKERDGGEITAWGWVNGQWGAIFPLSVLHTWFAVDTRPDEAATLYAVLGVPRTVAAADLKSAYRRAARQWHPDVCSDPDAGEQFRAIGRAYEVLGDPLKRRKYDAGLQLASTIQQPKGMSADYLSGNYAKRQEQNYGWKPPLRCGYILAEGQESLGRFVVSRILGWEDIVNAAGRALVTSWRFGDDSFEERWV